MSLLMDLLKKVGEKEKKPSVHPSVTKPPSRPHRRGFYLLVGVAMIIAGIGSYFLSTYLLEQVAVDVDYTERISEIKQRAQERQLTAVQEQEQEQEEETLEEEVAGVEGPSEEVVQEEPMEEKELVQAKMSQDTQKSEMQKIIGDIEEKKEVKPVKPFNPLGDYAVNIFYGDHYFKKGDLKKSLEFYEKAYSLRRSRKVANNLIVIYVRLGLLTKAEDLIKKDNDERLYYSYFLEVSRNLGPEEALEKIEKMKFNEKKGYISFAKGFILEKLGNVKEALESYEKAYKKDPSNPYFAYNYARLLDLSGNLKKAVVVYRMLNNQRLDPNLRSSVEKRLRELRSLGLGQ